jgi:hypothetical protein
MALLVWKQLEINESKWRDFIAVCYLEVTELNYVQSGKWRWRGRRWWLAQEILVNLGFQEKSGEHLYQIKKKRLYLYEQKK